MATTDTTKLEEKTTKLEKGKDEVDTTDEELDDKLESKKKEVTERIVPASNEAATKYNAAAATDKIDADTKLLSVITNVTIGELTTTTNLATMPRKPLSAYEFKDVDTSSDNNYGMTPFLISTEIPQMFTQKVILNAQQQTNIVDESVIKFSAEGINSSVKQSIDIFNIATMTVRTVLNDAVGKGKILDPNNLGDGSMKLQTVERSGLVNFQASINFIENRIFSLISAFLALDNILVQMQKKITVFDSTTGGPLARSIASLPFYAGMKPHLFFAIYSNLPTWAKTELEQLYEENPLKLGDTIVTSYAGRKLSQTSNVIIDQYTARSLNLNYKKLKDNLISTDLILNKIKASMLHQDDVVVTLLSDIESFHLLYDYTPQEYQIFVFYLLTNIKAKEQVIHFLTKELKLTNRLSTTPIEEIWTRLTVGDAISASFDNAFASSIHIGDESTPYELMIYESFADFFHFELAETPISTGFEALVQIMNIYIFIVLYPKMAQRMIHLLGYKLVKLYSSTFHNIYVNYTKINGDIRTDWGDKQLKRLLYQLSENESQQGYVYSIFTPRPAIPTTRVVMTSLGLSQKATTTLNTFTILVNSLAELVLPTTHIYTLDRKRDARYPYIYADYTAYASWEPLPHTTYSLDSQSTLADKVITITNLIGELKSLVVIPDNEANGIPRGFNTYFTNWVKHIGYLMSTLGPAYQVTCTYLQQTLYNSPFFLGSMYDPNPNRFFFVPRSIGIGALPGAPQHMVIIPPTIKVAKFRINIGTCLALSLEGEFLRPTINPKESYQDITRSDKRLKDNMTCLNGVALYKMANSMISSSRKFGFAMQFTQWMTTPADADNPFGPLVIDIASYMRMATWVPLVRKIFDVFGQDFDVMFALHGDGPVIVDGRSLSRTLQIINPANNLPIAQPPVNSIFNKELTYMNPIDIEKINALRVPLLSLASPIIYVIKDWYIGKMVVDELGPTQPENLGIANWTDETNVDMSFFLKRVPYKQGQAAQLTYKSLIDGKVKTIILPYTAKSVPILLINMSYTKQLGLTFLDVIAHAVAEGKIILRVNELRIRVSIEDMPSRVLDYSDSALTKDEIYNIIVSPAGCVLERTFKTTKYATNFTSSTLVQPGYIQWFATHSIADKNLFVSSITNAIVRPPQTHLPSSDELGFGGGDTFSNGQLKFTSPIINFNNPIHTVSGELLDTLSIRITPSVPGFIPTS